jgi:hypothetical protein
VKITIESTSKIVELQGHLCTVPARVWEGTSERGVKVVAFITRITPGEATPEQCAEFEADLQETRVPSSGVQAWPARLVL